MNMKFFLSAFQRDFSAKWFPWNSRLKFSSNAKSGEVKSSARQNHFKRQRSLIVNHKRSRILMTGHDDYGLLCKKSGGASMLTCLTIENCTKAWRLIELMLTPLSRCIFEPLVLSYRHRECYVAVVTWVCGHLSPFYPQHSSSTIEWVFK